MSNIRHSGRIVAMDGSQLSVSITQKSACASCHSRSVCTMSEQKDKVLRIKTENPQQYHIDQVVTVVMRTSLGLKAVLWAYVLPFIVLMASLFAGALLLHNELYGALIALGGTALYYVVLSLFREKLDRKMTAEIQVV